MELHALTLAACSYALLIGMAMYNAGYCSFAHRPSRGSIRHFTNNESVQHCIPDSCLKFCACYLVIKILKIKPVALYSQSDTVLSLASAHPRVQVPTPQF